MTLFENDIIIGIKKEGTNKFIDITRFVDPKNLPRSKPRLDNKFIEFELGFNRPEDDLGNYIFIDSSDTIAILESYNKVLFRTSVGIPIVINDKLLHLGENEDGSLDSYIFGLTLRQKNFSFGVYEINEIEVKPLSYYLDTYIFNSKYLLPGALGGLKADGTFINPYVLPLNLDIYIQPYNRIDDSAGHLFHILKSIKYYSLLEYFVEPDDDNLFNIFGYVNIFDFVSGKQNISPVFRNPITRDILKEGVMLNPSYDGISSEPQFIPFLKPNSFKHVKDSTKIVNMVKLIAYVMGKSSVITKFEEKSDGKNYKYNIGKSLDILGVAREVITKVISKNSNTVFTIDSDKASLIRYDSERLTNNNLNTKLVCKIISNNTTYYRYFTISNNTITLTGGAWSQKSQAAAIDTLTLDDSFYLANGYDILHINAKSFPGDGNGYVKKEIKPGKDCFFEFIKFDKPNATDNVVCYHYALEDFSDLKRWLNSIQKYGQYFETLKIDGGVTREEIETISNEFREKSEPLEWIEFLSNAPEFAELGSLLTWEISDRIKGGYLIDELSNKFISPLSVTPRKATFEQHIKASSYIDNLETLLSKINSRNEVNEARLFNENTDIFEFNIIFEYFSSFSLIDSNLIPTYTEKILLAKNVSGLWQIYNVSPDGATTSLIDDSTNTLSTLNVYNPIFNKSNSRYYFLAQISGYYELCSINHDYTDFKQVTSFGFNILDFVISPNGQKILYTKDTAGGGLTTCQVFIMNIDGSNSIQISNQPYGAYYGDFSPDGSLVIYCANWANTGHGIYTKNSDNTGSEIWWYSTGLRNYQVKWSNDGEKIGVSLYVSGGTTPGYYMDCINYTSKISYGLIAGGLSGRHAKYPTFSPDSAYLLYSRNTHASSEYKLERYNIASNTINTLFTITDDLTVRKFQEIQI